MIKNDEPNESLESLIAEIKELSNEILDKQKHIENNIENHFKVTMKKLDKLKEFSEIADMTNQVFETRLSSIEEKINRSIEVRMKK